jgi:ribosomal protein L1
MDCDPKTIDKNNNKGDDENENEIEDNVQKLLDEAKLNFDKSVLAAYDLFTYKI